MTKKDLAHIAKVMYDLQEYCRYIDDINNHEECDGYTFLFDHVKCKLVMLTKADIERLECDEE